MATKSKKAKTPSTAPGAHMPLDVDGDRGARGLRIEFLREESHSLRELADRYLTHLEEKGRSAGTLFSYGMELKAACKVLGDDVLVTQLSTDDVLRFFNCERVTLLRSGKRKSPLSIDKTRRVLRLALDWAVTQGWIEATPVPEIESAGNA